MKTKIEDLDALERRLLRPGVGVVDLPAAFVAGMIDDLRGARDASTRFDELVARADTGKLRRSTEEWS